MERVAKEFNKKVGYSEMIRREKVEIIRRGEGIEELRCDHDREVQEELKEYDRTTKICELLDKDKFTKEEINLL